MCIYILIKSLSFNLRRDVSDSFLSNLHDSPKKKPIIFVNDRRKFAFPELRTCMLKHSIETWQSCFLRQYIELISSIVNNAIVIPTLKSLWMSKCFIFFPSSTLDWCTYWIFSSPFYLLSFLGFFLYKSNLHLSYFSYLREICIILLDCFPNLIVHFVNIIVPANVKKNPKKPSMNSVSTNILNQIRDSDFDERDREDNVKKVTWSKRESRKVLYIDLIKCLHVGLLWKTWRLSRVHL